MLIKEIKFETDKGKFLLVDMTGGVRKFIPWDFVDESFDVKDITEVQAESIVDSTVFIFTPGESTEYNYLHKNYETNDLSWSFGAKGSLLSLIKSLGVYLFENPFSDIPYDADECHEYFENIELQNEAEKLTFYNPVILKLK